MKKLDQEVLNSSPSRQVMLAHAMEKVGAPAREGGTGYSMAQSQELMLHSLDCICVMLDGIQGEIIKLKKFDQNKNQLRPM